MNAWVGMDVSKATLDVVVLRDSDAQQTQVSNDQAGWRTLENFLKKRCGGKAPVCLEATGLYGDGVAQWLHERGWRVSVVNPARLKAYADSRLSRNKTDRADAALIADFCRTQQPDAWTPLLPEVAELRALLRHLDDLLGIRQQEDNRLKSGVASPTVQAHLTAHLAFLDAQIATVKQQIDDHFDQHPPLRAQRDLLTSIPGIGDLTAGRLLAELRDLRAFDSAAQVAAFVGVTPRQHTSGSSVRRRSRMSKQGNSALRGSLYWPAISAMRWNPCVRALTERLRAKGHCQLSCIVAAMHKLLHLAYGVLKSGVPFDPLFQAKRHATP